MISIANLATIISLASTSLALAVGYDGNIHLPLVRRGARTRTKDEWKSYRDFVTSKFTPAETKKTRSKRGNTANVPLTNLEFDTSYFAQVNIGTPGTSFNVILDTGSSDLWVAGSQCQGCTQSTTLNPSSSSSIQLSQQTIELQYGSGQAAGTLVEDTVSIGGFTVQNQQFVLAEQVSQGLLQGTLSGLLGLGFDAIAQTRATPLIQALAKGNQLSNPEMSFFLERLIDDNNAPSEAPGGTFTIGGTNSSLFQGNIDFVNLPSNVQPSFWLLPVTAVGVQGQTLTVSSSTQSLAAIDTGTTLIGGPSEAVAEIYSKINGSQELGGQMQGYFSIPCSTSVQTSFTFSSKTWSIDPVDFTVQQLSPTDCLGAIFGLDLGGQGPDWVVGDTFLKNVYSVFRFSPPSVGFAELASNLQGSQSPSTPESTHTGSLPGNPLPSSSQSGSNPFGSGGVNNPFSPTSGAALSLKDNGVGYGSSIGLLSVLLIAIVSGAWIL